MEFVSYRWMFIDKLQLREGVSFGLHWDWRRFRVDLHIANVIISIGKVPIYRTNESKLIAVSGSYHDRQINHNPDLEYDKPRR